MARRIRADGVCDIFPLEAWKYKIPKGTATAIRLGKGATFKVSYKKCEVMAMTSRDNSIGLYTGACLIMISRRVAKKKKKAMISMDITAKINEAVNIVKTSLR